MGKQKKKKKTLYDTLVEQFMDAGYTVKEYNWLEGIGYKESTREYWFDVIYKKEGDLIYSLHYWFGPDLNKLLYVECWTHQEIITEGNHKKLF
jgi:hypothetical protein